MSLTSEKTGKTPIDCSNEALALIRSLGRLAAEVPDYLEFAQQVCKSIPCAERAATLLREGNYVAMSATGKDAVSKLGQAYENFLTLSTPTRDSLRNLEDSLDYVERLLAASTNRLFSDWESQPDILSAKASRGFLAFHTEILFALCHAAATHFGLGVLSSIREVELGNIVDSFEDMTIARKQLLMATRNLEALGGWVIDKSELGDGLFDKVSGYVFSMVSGDISSIVSDGVFRRISRNLYVSEGESKHVIVGQGYIVGASFNNSYKLKDEKAHGSLPCYAFEEEGFDVADPIGSISRFFAGDDAFCIHPEELAKAMDREERGRAVKVHSTHFCPSCGKPTDVNLFCGGGR